MAAGDNLANKRSIKHRMAMIEQHTAGLRPGWYVLDGFFWDDECSVIAGPFTTQDDALTCRSALERSEAHHQYYIDEVEARLSEGNSNDLGGSLVGNPDTTAGDLRPKPHGSHLPHSR
ncbi:MAG: hypothetical protein WCE76_20250 [Mycobacterium sp.]